MNPATILYILATFSVFIAERLFGADDATRWPMIGFGVVLALLSLATRARSFGNHPSATRMALAFQLVSMISAVLYALQTKDVLAAMKLDADAEKHVRVVLQCGVPLLWFVGALPAFGIHRTLAASPHSVHPLRIRSAVEGGLAVSLGIAMLFPLNYLGTEYNERFDYGFFKTTEVGTATHQIVDNLEAPLRAVIFFPSSSEVLREVRPYFDDLEGPNLTVEIMDAVLDPEQAKAWKVRDNGTIAFIRGAGDDEHVETVKIGDKLDSAKKDLKKLDSKVQTALLKLAKDKRTVYFTVGHDEMYWKNAADDQHNIDTFKKVVEGLNFKVKELGIDDGLAQQVPDDAAMVFVMGPKKRFFTEEVTALKAYRDGGGAIFLMLEPGDDAQTELAALGGVTFDPTVVLSDKAFVAITRGPSDRENIVTNKFTSHESMTTLTKNSQQAQFIAPTCGSIKEASDHTGKVTVTMKGMPDWFADRNANFEFDGGEDPIVAEKRGGYEIAAVASGPAADGKEWRVATVADTTWASNFVLTRNQASLVYLLETTGWLTQDPSLGGETETEEDIKIVHTKDGEGLWFYGTIVLLPLLAFTSGALRVNSRRKKGAA